MFLLFSCDEEKYPVFREPVGEGGVLLDNIEIPLVFVEGGSFMMGDMNGNADEKPLRNVTVSSFEIGKYEVTQGQWMAVMGTNPSFYKGCIECPVENISWNEIQHFIQKLNKMTGKYYRLPTEAEWEYAARGGAKKQGHKYAGSNEPQHIAWYNSNAYRTQRVGLKQANQLGIYDMTGNVWEWCHDWYDPNYYAYGPRNNPFGPPQGEERVGRGGSFSNDPQRLRNTNRMSGGPDERNLYLGFRLVNARQSNI